MFLCSPRQSPSTAKSDLDELREQNQALALALGKLNPALVKGSPDELKKQLATAKGTRAFIDSVQSHLESPAFLSALDKRNPMYIVASQDHADEVGVVDLEVPCIKYRRHFRLCF